MQNSDDLRAQTQAYSRAEVTASPAVADGGQDRAALAVEAMGDAVGRLGDAGLRCGPHKRFDCSESGNSEDRSPANSMGYKCKVKALLCHPKRERSPPEESTSLTSRRRWGVGFACSGSQPRQLTNTPR